MCTPPGLLPRLWCLSCVAPPLVFSALPSPISSPLLPPPAPPLLFNFPQLSSASPSFVFTHFLTLPYPTRSEFSHLSSSPFLLPFLISRRDFICPVRVAQSNDFTSSSSSYKSGAVVIEELDSDDDDGEEEGGFDGDLLALFRDAAAERRREAKKAEEEWEMRRTAREEQLRRLEALRKVRRRPMPSPLPLSRFGIPNPSRCHCLSASGSLPSLTAHTPCCISIPLLSFQSLPFSQVHADSFLPLPRCSGGRRSPGREASQGKGKG